MNSMIIDPMQQYINRECMMSMLDESVFDILNDGEFDLMVSSNGCLDAPSRIPAGSVRNLNDNFYTQSMITR
jgi:hypothetical protein